MRQNLGQQQLIIPAYTLDGENMKKFFATIAFAASLIFPVAAGAVTTFNVTDNPGGQVLPSETGIADGGVYGTGLTNFDSVSIGILSSAGTTTGAIGFTFSPSPLISTVEIALTGADFGFFGTTNIHLSTSTLVTDAFASATATAPGAYMFFGVQASSPLFVLFDWTNDVSGSFNADVSLAPIPVPAAGGLLLTMMVAGGIAARRKKKAA